MSRASGVGWCDVVINERDCQVGRAESGLVRAGREIYGRRGREREREYAECWREKRCLWMKGWQDNNGGKDDSGGFRGEGTCAQVGARV
eukprot:6212689-Pleurochrysis_carterae.AAC.2